MAHLATPTSTTTSGKATLGGWNGVFINRGWNCWVNNVRLVNLECGVLLGAAKNCSVLNTFITSTDPTHWYHHPYALRQLSSDNLIENFTIDGPGSVRHGISIENYSSGNVYSKGLIKVGTFDTHRALAFDLIRTEITVANDHGAGSGGDSQSGPYAGKRVAHWNVIQKMQAGYPYQDGVARLGDNIFEPLQYPMGALVAITGPRDNSVGEFVSPPLSGGTLGAMVVTGSIDDPALTNLYHAELSLRKQSSGFTLNTVTSGRGTVSKTLSQAVYESGTEVTLTATPATGQTFAGWSGDTVSTINPLTITINTTKTIVANFKITDQLSPLSENKSGAYTLSPGAKGKRGIITDSAALTQTVVPGKRSMVSDASSQGNKRIKSNSFTIKFWPNPAHNILNIYVTGLQEKTETTISVISFTGVVMKVLWPIGLNKSLPLDVSSLPGGVYIIKIMSGDKVMYKEFVKT